jgi:hypothetical protein
VCVWGGGADSVIESLQGLAAVTSESSDRGFGCALRQANNSGKRMWCRLGEDTGD